MSALEVKKATGLWGYNDGEGYGVTALEKGMGYVTTMEGEEGAGRLSQAIKKGKHNGHVVWRRAQEDGHKVWPRRQEMVTRSSRGGRRWSYDLPEGQGGRRWS